MPKPRSTDAKLERLRLLRDRPAEIAGSDRLAAVARSERPESTAMLALSALAILSYDARVVERAAEVVQSRDLADLNEMFAKTFAR